MKVRSSEMGREGIEGERVRRTSGLCREDKIISGTSECEGFQWKWRPDRNPGRERTIIDAD